MKKREVLQRLKAEAKRQGKAYRTVELARHTGVIVGSVRSTISRSSSEVPDGTAHACWDQFAVELGKGWWRG